MYGDSVRTFGCPAKSHPYSAGAFLSRPDAKQRHIAADILVSLSSSSFYACESLCILQAEQGSTQQPSAAIKSLYVDVVYMAYHEHLLLCRWPASSIFASFKGTDTVFINITALPPNGSVTYGINW